MIYELAQGLSNPKNFRSQFGISDVQWDRFRDAVHSANVPVYLSENGRPYSTFIGAPMARTSGQGYIGIHLPCLPSYDSRCANFYGNTFGISLPQTLRKIYLNVANGGFGPGYGVMGVEGGFTDDLGHTVADLYESYRHSDPEDPSWQWPEQFLPICHWGCVIYSVVDCSRSPAPIYFADVSGKEPGEPMETILHFHKPSFEAWLGDWLDGKDLWGEVCGDDVNGDS